MTPKTALLPMMATVSGAWGIPEVVPVSARTGEGCDVLLDRAYALLPEADPPFPEDFLTDQPERALVAERVREQLLRHTRQELPHATAVLVARWNRRPDGLIEIEARILVERESQKGIVIGKGGAVLKAVGTEARKEIEAMLEARVFLELRVEVSPDWRNDWRALQVIAFDIGYADPWLPVPQLPHPSQRRSPPKKLHPRLPRYPPKKLRQPKNRATWRDTDPYKANPETLSMVLVKGGQEKAASLPEGETIEDNRALQYIEDTLNIDITFSWIVPSDSYLDKLNLAITSGDIPDVIDCGFSAARTINGC